MRRAVVTASATAAGVILLLSLKPHAGLATAGAKPVSSDPSGLASDQPTATPSAGTRSITGDSVDTRYGPVQVRVALAGSRITRIDVLRYPTESGRDQAINSYALPLLNKEAIAAQSANIDAVSGASYTSDGYTQSLQSALDKARS